MADAQAEETGAMANPAPDGDPQNKALKVLASLGTALFEGAPLVLMAASIYFGLVRLSKSVETVAKSVETGATTLSKGVYSVSKGLGGRKGG